MPRVVHIVVTDGFAGVERYVCGVTSETAAHGWEVLVVGGAREGMLAALDERIRWEPGATPIEAVRSLVRLGRFDICHTHMTIAEAVGVATRPVHRASIVTTRHFAAHRGASRLGGIAAPWIARAVSREIAVGEFVASHLERSPSAIALSGVHESPCLWRPENRVVLVLQRLEAEKDTATALRAWKASQLLGDGWSLRIVGDGSQRESLERLVEAESIRGVTFAGRVADVASEFARAGMLLAPARAEPLGLSVLEAMSAGVPVVASASGGHLETVGIVDGAPLFPAGDAVRAAARLRALQADDLRAALSLGGRSAVAERFTMARHLDALLRQYAAARSPRRLRRSAFNGAETA